jgi:hypothetical protein
LLVKIEATESNIEKELLKVSPESNRVSISKEKKSDEMGSFVEKIIEFILNLLASLFGDAKIDVEDAKEKALLENRYDVQKELVSYIEKDFPDDLEMSAISIMTRLNEAKDSYRLKSVDAIDKKNPKETFKMMLVMRSLVDLIKELEMISNSIEGPIKEIRKLIQDKKQEWVKGIEEFETRFRA